MNKLYSYFLFIVLTGCLFFSTPQTLKAQLLTHELLASYTPAELQDVLDDFGDVPQGLLNLEYGVDLYKLTYNTPDAQGETTLATGAVAVPQGYDCPFPLASYQHGTVSVKTDVPSYMYYEVNIGLIFASTGYVVAMPDYLGLGDSPGLHPYVHAATEASASIDMLRSTRQLSTQLDFPLNDQLFIFGYSQGGHATMALFKELETNYAQEFTVTAAAPMSGPYDMSVTQAAVIWEPYATPAYLPYILFGYQEAYGNLYEEVSDVLVEPYATTLPPLFNGEYGLGDVANLMPDTAFKIFKPDVLEAYLNDDNHPLKIALRDNDLYDWLPQAPILILGCEGDDQVVFESANIAYDTFLANGADPDKVEVVNFGGFDHSGCIPFCLLGGQAFFEKHKDISNGMEISFDLISFPSGGNADGLVVANVTGGSGDYTYSWNNGMDESTLSNLSSGIYTLTVYDALGCNTSAEIDLFPVGINDLASTNNIQCYPNPATNQVRIDLPAVVSNDAYNLSIHNLAGQTVRSYNKIQSKTLSISVASLKAGIYLVKISNNNTSYQTKLMVY